MKRQLWLGASGGIVSDAAELSDEDLRRAEWELSDDDDAPDGLSDDLGQRLLEGYKRLSKEVATLKAELERLRGT